MVYEGYRELAYLHPDRFTPDLSHLELLDVVEEEPYLVIRLVAWICGYYINDSDFNDLEDAVDRLSQDRHVLISSESPLPSDLVQRSF